MNIKLELLQNEIFDLLKNRLDELNIDADSIANTTAIKALSEIKDVIQNDSLSDFDTVEMIVCIFEKYHISANGRHDFG